MIILYSVIGFLVAITFHEFMHAWTAHYLGDETAKRSGRLTLNPIAHMDPFGTVLLPGILILTGSPIVFGYAKPVPINPNNFKNPRVGSALTAIAGPISNFFVASVLAIFLALVPTLDRTIATGITVVILINTTLMVFNLLPLPPLDGSKFFALFFPALDNPKFELYGPFILLLFLLIGGFRYIFPVVTFILFNLFHVNPALLI